MDLGLFYFHVRRGGYFQNITNSSPILKQRQNIEEDN